jgi:hypothetical protein
MEFWIALNGTDRRKQLRVKAVRSGLKMKMSEKVGIGIFYGL